MSLLKKAAQSLIVEMERQGIHKALFYTVNPDESGFHPLIEFTKNLELLELEENVQMVISEVNIGQLRVLVDLL